MEKITVREFRKNLSSYLVRIKQGESFTVNGVHITQVIAFAEASCTHATSEETTVEIAKPEEVYTDPQTVEKELKKKNFKVKKVGENMETSEDGTIVKSDLSKPCSFESKPKKFPKAKKVKFKSMFKDKSLTK